MNPDPTTRNPTAAPMPPRRPQRPPTAEAAGAAENGRPFPAPPWQTGFPQLPQPLLLLTQGDRREKTRVYSNTAEVAHFQTLGGSLSETSVIILVTALFRASVSALGGDRVVRSLLLALLCAASVAAIANAVPITGGQTVAEADESPISEAEYTDCRPTTTPLVFDGGYRVSLCYETAEGLVGEANGGIWASGQSGLLWFFDRDNAEVLVKVLDGCSHNGRRWIFVAPVTDVAFNLRVTSSGGREWTHRNRLGVTAVTRSDTSTFVCDTDDADGVAGAGLRSETATGQTAIDSPISEGEYTDCSPSTTPLVFDGGYWVSLCYETAEGLVGEARGGIWASNQSGLLWFFSRGNAEVLVKVLNGCSHNGRRWIYVAPVTDVAFNLHVTSSGGRKWTHRNRLGVTAATKSDTSAFVCDTDDGIIETVSVARASAEEGDSVEFTVTQSAVAPSDTVLGWSTAAGRATSGTDFTAVTAGMLTISAGETTGKLTVSTVEDTLAEADETFTVTITGSVLPAHVTLGTATATGTIQDDDVPVAGSIASLSVEPTHLTPAHAGKQGADTIMVTALDGGGSPVANASYRWLTDRYSGWVYPPHGVTDDRGRFQTTWVAGWPGEGTLSLTVENELSQVWEELATLSTTPSNHPDGAVAIWIHHQNNPSTGYSIDMTPLAEPNDTYYGAIYWDKGYAGLQRGGFQYDRQLQFSVWDAPGHGNAELIDKASDVLCGTFGNEGTGVACALNYPWAVGSAYRFEVTEEEMNGGSAMTLAVTDLAAGSKRFVGTIRFARRAEMTSFAAFVEDFRRTAQHCLAREVRSAAIRRPRALISGAWVALDEMTRGHLPRPTEDPSNPGTPYCANLAAREHAAGLELVIGGETASDPGASSHYTIPKN